MVYEGVTETFDTTLDKLPYKALLRAKGTDGKWMIIWKDVDGTYKVA